MMSTYLSSFLVRIGIDSEDAGGLAACGVRRSGGPGDGSDSVGIGVCSRDSVGISTSSSAAGAGPKPARENMSSKESVVSRGDEMFSFAALYRVRQWLRIFASLCGPHLVKQ